MAATSASAFPAKVGQAKRGAVLVTRAVQSRDGEASLGCCSDKGVPRHIEVAGVVATAGNADEERSSDLAPGEESGHLAGARVEM